MLHLFNYVITINSRYCLWRSRK